MYYPYLRGKQFELIALRDLTDLISENKTKISPIIEPIKISSTLEKTLLDFKNKDINFTLIINPQVGDLTNQSDEILSYLLKKLEGYSNYQIGIILERKFDYLELLAKIDNSKIDCAGFSLIHNVVISNIDKVVENCSKVKPIINNIINFDKTNSNRRYYRNFSKNTWVSLADYFDGKDKNSDYLQNPESQYTEEHLYYSDEGYKGFGDFLTIGEKYSEAGFLPWAVAIHISYADENKHIKVKHFVSDSNGGVEDPGGKFSEALEKLINWIDANQIHETEGLRLFKELHSTGHFPGLGVLKKLSIMNHIELVLKLI